MAKVNKVNVRSADRKQRNYGSDDAGDGLSPSNLIAAVCIISESELAKVMDYTAAFSEQEGFLQVLYGLGMDTTRPVIRQDALQHRNRFNEIVICSRWVGDERTDAEWINSGYASREAIDKATGSKILEDIYRAKYLTVDMQAMLESRDRYAKTDDKIEKE